MSPGRAATAALVACALAGAAGAFPAYDRPFDPNDPLAAEFEAAQDLIRREAWPEAEARLRSIASVADDVADVWSLLGFSRRKLGRFDAAETAYDRALALDPGHLGALEYLGELRLEQGNVEAAQALLRRLEALCPFGCEERTELAEAIRAAQGASQ